MHDEYDLLRLARFRPGRSRQLTTYQLDSREKVTLLPPKSRTTIAEASGAGVLTRLWLTFPNWFWQHWHTDHPVDPTVLRKLTLRIYWDDEATPSVEAPMGDFFGVGHCEFRHYLSQFLGMSSGGFYCYFPMPFANGLRIEVENEDDAMNILFLNANYQELATLPNDVGRFHAQFRCGENQPGREWVAMEAEGRGHFVGCAMNLQGAKPNYLGYLEGPERIYVDGEDRPSIFGTGTEDYFNGGWYFRDGEFAGPYHGVPLKDPLRSMVSMYRFHDADAISFERSLRVAFVHGLNNDAETSKYATVAYWYQSEPHAPFPVYPDVPTRLDLYRIRDSDHQSIP